MPPRVAHGGQTGLKVFNKKNYVAFSPVYFRRLKFYSRRIWYEKPAPKSGAWKWCRFMATVSGA